jgi:hypothetical protein
MKAYGSGCIDPHFLDLGTSWRWVVNFTPRPLSPRGKSPRYPLDRMLGGPQSRDSICEPSVVQPIASRYTDYASEEKPRRTSSGVPTEIRTSFPPRRPGFEPKSGHVGFAVDKTGAMVSILLVLLFPLPVLIPPTVPHSSFIIRGWYNRPNSGRRTKWTQSHLTSRN